MKLFGRRAQDELGRTKSRRANALTLPQNASPASGAWAQLSVSDVATLIEHHIDHAPDDSASVGAACQSAITNQVPVVVCRPEQVANAAVALSGTGTQVATAIDFHRPGDPALTGTRLRSEAQSLLDAGASELALIATRERLQQAGIRSFTDDLLCLNEILAGTGARTRAVIDGREMSSPTILATATHSLNAGAQLIECGTPHGGRIRLGLLCPLRETLGPVVKLKWAPRVRTLDMLLIGLAEGADRFNGDPADILRQAQDRQHDGGIRIPQPGEDY